MLLYEASNIEEPCAEMKYEARSSSQPLTEEELQSLKRWQKRTLGYFITTLKQHPPRTPSEPISDRTHRFVQLVTHLRRKPGYGLGQREKDANP